MSGLLRPNSVNCIQLLNIKFNVSNNYKITGRRPFTSRGCRARIVCHNSTLMKIINMKLYQIYQIGKFYTCLIHLIAIKLWKGAARLSLYFNRPSSIGTGIGIRAKKGGIIAVRLNQYSVPCKEPKQAIAILSRKLRWQEIMANNPLGYGCSLIPTPNLKIITDANQSIRPSLTPNYNGDRDGLRGLSGCQPTNGGRDRGRA